MKKAMMISGIIFLGHITTANAATDWTPYLKPMLSGCFYPEPSENLPARYKASVVSKKITFDRTDADSDYDGEKTTTYTLKNATAFGQPLLKVEELEGYEWGHLKLYFKDTKFTALRPQFKLPKFDTTPGSLQPKIINNSSGYNTIQESQKELIFNKKEKSITCYGGL